jgi:hypothetical protein
MMQCAGSFKYQHDTDKDLKFIHVFPKIDTAAAAAAAPQADDGEAEIKVAGMSLEELPPEHLCAIVSLDTFGKLYSKQCPSFSQRRALLKALKELAARIAGTKFDNKKLIFYYYYVLLYYTGIILNFWFDNSSV